MRHRRTVFCLAIALLLASTLRAQVPRGLELRLNRSTAGQQLLPAVAAAPGRGFVAVWQESTSAPGSFPVVKARLFSGTGAARSGEITVGTGLRPAVAMGTDGHFVVTWEELTTTKAVVFGRRYAADGKPLAAAFQLDLSDHHFQFDPSIAMAADGHFVIVWSRQDGLYDYDSSDIYGRIFQANGKPSGPAFPVFTDGEEQSSAKVALAGDGSFVVVCNSFGGEGTFDDVFARLFDADGAPSGDPFQVNSDPNTDDTSQFEPAVARMPDGRFVVAWTDYGSDPNPAPPYDSGTGIRARLYAADGTPAGDEFRVNVFTTGAQQHPSAAVTSHGSFLISWQSGANQDGDKDGIFARAFSPNGAPRGGDFRINLTRAGAQTHPAIFLGTDGHGVAAWETPDGDGSGIDSRVLVLSN